MPHQHIYLSAVLAAANYTTERSVSEKIPSDTKFRGASVARATACPRSPRLVLDAEEVRADVRDDVEEGRHHEDDREDARREHRERPVGVDEEGEPQRADDEVQLVEPGERRAALPARPPLEEGSTDVAAHRAERERERRR